MTNNGHLVLEMFSPINARQSIHPLLQYSTHDHTADIPSDISVPGQLTTVEFEPMEISQIGELEEPLLVLENKSTSTMPDGSADYLVENTLMSLDSWVVVMQITRPQGYL